MKCKVADTVTQITQINFFSIYATAAAAAVLLCAMDQCMHATAAAVLLVK